MEVAGPCIFRRIVLIDSAVYAVNAPEYSILKGILVAVKNTKQPGAG